MFQWGGEYNSAQIADLVCLYILKTLVGSLTRYKLDYTIMTGFYTSPSHLVYKIKIISALKFLGFKIEMSSNIKIANFLNLSNNNSYMPFLKTNQYPSYIDVNSNHPSSIIKQLPKAVNTRIRRLSSNKKIFHESSKIYIEEPQRLVVLKKSLAGG